MITELQRQLFETLRSKELAGDLGDDEQVRLKQLTRLVVDEETTQLAATTAHLRAERLEIQKQNSSLRKLERRQEALARKLERFLSQVQTERASINAEISTILKDSGSVASR
jgi:septal ring factor EnvC (AmiA/AmiB activator)